MDIRSGQKVLLTGAGFTHNFGTPLADGMWAEIFNQRRVHETPRVRDMLAGKFDFEGVYNAILTGEFTKEEKKVIRDAVFAAYEKLDGIVIEYPKYVSTPVHHHDFSYQALIAKFGVQSSKRFFFTLNQDLFVERFYGRSDYPRLIRPGAQEKIRWFDLSSRTRRLKDEDFIRLPSSEVFDPQKDSLLPDEGFFYIKLHGSQDWLSFDGERQMVLGRGKEGQIEREPLLREYLQVFHDVLCQPDRDLLVIGYGFGDDHINRTIAEAVTDHRLKLYVLSPQSPSDFFKSFRQPIMGQLGDAWPNVDWKEHMEDIWSGLAGYFPYHLTKMLPGPEKTQDWRTVFERFFGEVESNSVW